LGSVSRRVGILCSVFLSLFLLYTRNCEWGQLRDILFGSVATPYRYRMLGPLAIRAIMGYTAFTNPNGLTIHTANLIYIGFVYFWLLYFVFSYLRDFMWERKALLGMTLAAFGIWWNETPQAHTWDALGLMFWIGLCHCILARKYAAWFFLFAVSVTNHESTLLLLPAAFLVWGRKNLWRATALVVSAAAVWLAVKWGLKEAFRGGSLIGGCNDIDWNLIHWPYALLSFAGSWVFALFGAWRLNKERRILLWTIPVFLAAMFRFGEFDELRIFTPLLAILLPAIVEGIYVVAELIGGGLIRIAARAANNDIGASLGAMTRSARR